MDLQALEGQQFGQYKLMAWLGEGAHVHAYLAREGDSGEYRVIKVLKSNLTDNEAALARFHQEAEAALSLDHPNVVKVYSYDREGDLLYLVEEFCEGGSLMDKLKANPEPLPLAFVVRTLEDIAAALDFAHARGIVHRDLKPENILYNAQGKAALSDLGVTKYADETEARSREGLVFGNPGYMSPEEWQRKAIDARTDIYALGIILFEMLTGQLPFEPSKTGSMMFVHLLHLMASPISVLELRQDLPPSVEPVISKAIEKDPDLRYQSAGELVAAFKAALDSKAAPLPKATPPSSTAASNGSSIFERAARRADPPSFAPPQFPPRPPLPRILFLALFAALLGLLYWWWQQRQAEQEAAEA
ncbi:MAG: serine/threonine protein kinase [Chloroflexi bacterium CFX4]|nr:serine/threonine protein kinase [Chloroflexi bacterium CFX4]MDL1922361.1 serine/threonine protein kinase [Chloroflexi bacterium CFX3]